MEEVSTVFQENITLDEGVVRAKGAMLNEMLIWSIACVCITVIGLGLATLKYFRDRYTQPESKKKRRDRVELDRREKEERAVSAVKKEAIPMEQFLSRLKQKKLDKYLNIEVRAIVKNQDEYPCTIPALPENMCKNSNQEVVSYDHSQIQLEDPPEGENTYLNASYIDGFLHPREYIATQGPRQKTVASFWHMIWQEDVHCVVMATGLFENALQQCDKYWGDVMSLQKYVRHGNIHIWLEGTIVMAKLIIRTFRVQKEGCCGERRVRQYEMAGFSDENTDPGFMLECVRRIQNYMMTVPGPILIHCRCGGGRTAVFIAIDYCLKQIDTDDAVDVYSTVLHLRRFRKNMVRTLLQYRFIYDVVALHIQCGVTVAPTAQLQTAFQKLSLKYPRAKMTGLEKQFQTAMSITPRLSIGDCAGGHRSENRSKSRDIMLLPPEQARPYLLTAESGDNGTDFINAVFVDGYYQENNFLVTQWPMHNTVSDIWRLIYDYKITSLVVLNDVKIFKGRIFLQNYPYFWPRELDKEEKFGPIGVKYVGSQKYPNIVIRAFAVRKNSTSMPVVDVMDEYLIVKMFHLMCWSSRDKPPLSTKSLVFMMGCVEEWQQKTNPLRPVCLMSKDGSSRCGVYCVINICCEQLKSEGEVDVFSAVRTVKKNRKELVPNIMEYTYCYTFLITMLKLMQEDTPKIVVTGPGSKDGMTNQNFQVTALRDRISTEELWSDASSRTWSFHTADENFDNPVSAYYTNPSNSLPNSLSLPKPATLGENRVSLSSYDSFYDLEKKSNSLVKFPLPSPGHIVTFFPSEKETNNNNTCDTRERMNEKSADWGTPQVQFSIGSDIISCVNGKINGETVSSNQKHLSSLDLINSNPACNAVGGREHVNNSCSLDSIGSLQQNPPTNPLTSVQSRGKPRLKRQNATLTDDVKSDPETAMEMFVL
ncbi:hypothetical protein ScPMuIL_001773 [Solemya velum]